MVLWPCPNALPVQGWIPDPQLARDTVVLISLQLSVSGHPVSRILQVIVICIRFRQIHVQVMKILQMCRQDMPLHNSKKYILVVGTLRQILAELDMAMLWALGAEVLSPDKENDF